jgi:MFS family permease
MARGSQSATRHPRCHPVYSHAVRAASLPGCDLFPDVAPGAARQRHEPAGQPRFFYGWLIVTVLSLISMVSMSMGGLSFGLFIKPMGDDLALGRAAFGWAHTARQVVGAANSPLTGHLIDRFGVRVLLPDALGSTAAAAIALAWLTEASQLVVLFGLMGLLAPREAAHSSRRCQLPSGSYAIAAAQWPSRRLALR